MGIFNPQVSSNVGFESPTSGLPSAPSGTGAALIGTGLGILDAIIPTEAERKKKEAVSGPSYTQQKDAHQINLLQGLQNGLMESQAMASQGDSQGAANARATVVTNYLRAGGEWNSEAKAAAETITGLSSEGVTRSQEALTLDRIRSSQEYTDYALIAPSSLDASQRDAWALAKVEERAAREAVITDNRIGWTSSKTSAIVDTIKEEEQYIGGILEKAVERNGSVLPSDIEVLKIQWETAKADLYGIRPQGVTDEQWSPIQARIDAMDTKLDIVQGLVSEQGMNADLMSQFLQSLPDDLPPGAQLVASNIIKSATMADLVVLQDSEQTEFIKGLIMGDFDPNTIGIEPDDEDNADNPTGNPEVLRESATKADAKTNFTTFSGVVQLINGVDTNRIASDSAYRNDFSKAAAVAFENLHTLAHNKGNFISAQTVKEKFDGRLVQGLNRLAQVEPEIASRLARQAQVSIAAHLNLANDAMNNSLNASIYDYVDGALVVNEDKFVSKLGEDELNYWKKAAVEFGYENLSALAADKTAVQQLIFRRESKSGPPYVRASMSHFNFEAGRNSVFRKQAASVEALNKAYATFNEVALNANDPARSAGVYETFDNKRVKGFNIIQENTKFLSGVSGVSERLDIDPNDLLMAISFETVGTFNPAIKNPNGSATGLIQFLESTAKGLGTSTAELSQMTATEQLKYVEQYLQPYAGKMKNLGDIYMAIHWPAGIGKDSSYVMYEKGSKAYDGNINLDSNKDGTITRGEALARVISHNKGGGYVSPKSISGTTSQSIGAFEVTTPEITFLDPPKVGTKAEGSSELGVELAPSANTLEVPNASPNSEPVTDTDTGKQMTSDRRKLAKEEQINQVLRILREPTVTKELQEELQIFLEQLEKEKEDAVYPG